MSNEEFVYADNKKLRFQVFIKAFFQKYLQVVDAFYSIFKNHFPVLLDGNLRQILY